MSYESKAVRMVGGLAARSFREKALFWWACWYDLLLLLLLFVFAVLLVFALPGCASSVGGGVAWSGEPYECTAMVYQESAVGHGIGVAHCVTFLLR